MKKIYKKNQLLEVNNIPSEVIESIKATIDIFKEKGVKFTMDDIATKLGVSKRTLYENVDSKECLLNLIVDTVFDSIAEESKQIINDQNIDDIERVKRLLTILPTSFKTIDYTKIYEIRKFYPKIYEKIIDKLDSGWEPTGELINKCIEKGLIKRVNLTLMKSVLIGGIRNLLEDDYLYKENLEYQEVMKDIVDIRFSY